MKIVRHLYQGKVIVTGEVIDAHSHDLVSPKVKIRVTRVTNRGWPYPPKVGSTLWVSRYPRGAR